MIDVHLLAVVFLVPWTPHTELPLRSFNLSHFVWLLAVSPRPPQTPTPCHASMDQESP